MDKETVVKEILKIDTCDEKSVQKFNDLITQNIPDLEFETVFTEVEDKEGVVKISMEPTEKSLKEREEWIEYVKKALDNGLQ